VLTIASCTVKHAIRYVREHHRHLPRVQGGLFAVRVVDCEGVTHGVAIAGNPPRVWQGTGRFTITRAATDETRNANSMLYRALCRAAKQLGYDEAWTYTLPEESGVSLRAAGFIDMGLTDGGEWDRPSRRRRPAHRAERKRRWVAYLTAKAKTRAVLDAGGLEVMPKANYCANCGHYTSKHYVDMDGVVRCVVIEHRKSNSGEVGCECTEYKAAPTEAEEEKRHAE
jgi:hypothetical protein